MSVKLSIQLKCSINASQKMTKPSNDIDKTNCIDT